MGAASIIISLIQPSLLNLIGPPKVAKLNEIRLIFNLGVMGWVEGLWLKNNKT